MERCFVPLRVTRFPLAETQAITENGRAVALRRRNRGRSEELKEAVQRRFVQGIAVCEDC